MSSNNYGCDSAHYDRRSPEYLAQLLNDKKKLQAFPNLFAQLEKLLDEEINKVRGNLFHLTTNKDLLRLPEPYGPVVTLSEKLLVPVQNYPEYNFVGRILGPRGMTAKQLELDTGCKIMVRGKGSMRDKVKEDQNRSKPNWEHLNEELHVLVTVEDTENRAEIKMQRAIEEVKKLLVPAPEGEDSLKRRQLMELAIINGTYRDTKAAASVNNQLGTSVPAVQTPRIVTPSQMALAQGLRSPLTAGTPIFLAPRLPQFSSMSSLPSSSILNGGSSSFLSPPEAGIVYFDPFLQSLFEYPTGFEHSSAGALPTLRRTTREHPYAR